MSKFNLPKALDLAERKNWTGLTVAKLVSSGRISPKEAASRSIEGISDEWLNEGIFPTVNEIPDLISELDELESNLFDILSSYQCSDFD